MEPQSEQLKNTLEMLTVQTSLFRASDQTKWEHLKIGQRSKNLNENRMWQRGKKIIMTQDSHER